MAWLRIESNFASHRKVLAAGQQLGKGAVARVIGIWTIGACYAVAHLTDGLVPGIILADTRYDKKPGEIIDAMVAAGLLHAEGNGYRLHDFNDYNPSAAEVLEKRRIDLARKREFQKNSVRNPKRIAAESEKILRVPNPNPNPSPKPIPEDRHAETRAPIFAHGQRGTPLVGNHARCFFAPEACARGLCIRKFLGLEWRQQGASDEAIRAFVRATISGLADGPIGDEPLKFWRAAWSARHGSQAPAPAVPAGPRQRAADVTLATLRRGPR